MKIINTCNRIIEYSFYALFLLVPLVFTNNTYELFEFNKMWLTFGLTLVIAASWLIKMIVKKEIQIQRTPLDIPIVLFLLSQIISTIFSLDAHISLWGYYSRFNGSLLSIISYILLYYAFVSNLSYLGNLIVKRLIKISLISGAIVALWGLPSHFGYDPTCLLFRGTFDVSCWTEAFQPRTRIFSTLGQPGWLAAYLAVLLPVAIAMFIKTLEPRITTHEKFSIFKKRILLSIFYLLLSVLFYLDLIFANTRAGFAAFWISLFFFITSYIWIKQKPLSTHNLKTTITRNWPVLIVLTCIGVATFLFGSSIPQLYRFTLPGIKEKISKPLITSSKKESSTAQQKAKPAPLYTGEMGGTDSGKIRRIVWRGAIDIWKHNPLFGTGVETFAFAYYKHRPKEHNLVSEWDYLYNKAHNEYLNYLATTGAFGLGTYILMIGYFLFLSLKKLITDKLVILNLKGEGSHKLCTDHQGILRGVYTELVECAQNDKVILHFALIAGYLSILISNFFGFSVVIVNLYFFLIPAFVLVLQNMIDPKKALLFLFTKSPPANHPSFVHQSKNIKHHLLPNLVKNQVSSWQYAYIIFVLLVTFYMLFTLFSFWQADKDYVLGYNFDKAGQYQQAYSYLQKAVSKRSDEPVFKDEFSSNNAILAVYLAYQSKSNPDMASTAAQLAQNAMQLSNEVILEHPNNVVFWKTRVRIFSNLSQVDPEYLTFALDSIKKAKELAPTDAKVSYSLGVLYAQNNQAEKAIEELENTIQLKPDYKDGYYALGLLYHESAVNKNGLVIKPELHKKAVAIMKYILTHLSSEESGAKQALQKWGESVL